MRKSILIFILILVAGLVPVSIYFIENPQAFDLTLASLPTRDLTPSEQLAQALAGLVVKPIYMMLSLIIILALIGQGRSYIVALQWGQITFLAGEIFCAINFYIYKHESILSEYLHSYGMALAFGFTSFALLEGWDMRFGSRSRTKVGQEAKIVLQFILPMLAALTFIPILSPLQTDAYAVSIFQIPYSYTRLEFYQLYERRILPVTALIMFVVAFLSLVKKDSTISFITKVFLCAGLGALGFSFFRVALNGIFADDLVWFEFWEEATELMYVGFVGFVLWQYRRALLDKTPMLEVINKTSEVS
jgi:hypothetical protein